MVNLEWCGYGVGLEVKRSWSPGCEMVNSLLFLQLDSQRAGRGHDWPEY